MGQAKKILSKTVSAKLNWECYVNGTRIQQNNPITHPLSCSQLLSEIWDAVFVEEYASDVSKSEMT